MWVRYRLVYKQLYPASLIHKEYLVFGKFFVRFLLRGEPLNVCSYFHSKLFFCNNSKIHVIAIQAFLLLTKTLFYVLVLLEFTSFEDVSVNLAV